MTPPKTDPHAVAWVARADELADWAIARLFVRTDRFGGYYRKKGKTHVVTRPTKVSPELFSRDLLLRHIRATRTEDVIGTHALTPGKTGTGRWVNNDIDLHGPEDDHERNECYALHQYCKLDSIGFRPLLLTWETGGFHLWVFFDRDIPGAELFAFGQWLVRDAKEFGYPTNPETFPKKPAVDKLGNWVRVPGRHHTHNVFASVYTGSAWVEGKAAVSHILSLTGCSPDLIPPDARPGKERTSATGGKAKTDSFKAKVTAGSSPDVFAAYNATVTLDDVVRWHEAKGHRVTARSAERVEFCRACKDGDGHSFNVAVIGGVPVTYNFSTKAGLPEGRGLSPSQVRCFYATGSCDTAAMSRFATVLRAELGWADGATATSAEPGSGVEIILAYFRERYRPEFRSGNAICTHDGEIIPMGVACEVPTSALIDALSGATDTPRYVGGAVKRDQLPVWFKKWSRVAWGDLLTELPDEDTVALASDSPAADEFRRLVREAMLTLIVLGQDVMVGTEDRPHFETKLEKRPVVQWCQQFAKIGPWRGLRGYKCWFKYVAKDGGELILRIAIRHDFFSQLKADRRLSEMGANKFTKRCDRYGIGKRGGMTERPHGNWAIVLDDGFVADLIGSPDVEEAGSSGVA
jgi:hypothetical protein